MASLLQAALDADEAWSAEGRKVFGARWGDVRYTPAARGEDFSPLRTAFEAYRLACNAWEAAGRPLDQEGS